MHDMKNETAIIEELNAIDEEVRWKAITEKDKNFDGVFVLAVLSTKIYCKPSCPARRPKRENIQLFNSPDEAENRGFRACLRCKPREETDAQTDLIKRACRLIEENLEETLSLEHLSKLLNVSKFHLQKIFKKQTGVSPRKYAEIHRVKKFKQLLKEGDVSVTDAIYEVGFGSSSRLYEKSNAQLGMTPKAYRKNGEGMKINYTIIECPLGLLLVAATEKGLCSVVFGDDENELKENLTKEFSRAAIAKDENGLGDFVNALLLHLEGQKEKIVLPLDIQATTFQTRVWEALRQIPYGETRSYTDIAKTLKQPTASRAVARACATNPVAVVTPCHRVVRENGDLSGYRWGVERKKKLLESEKRNSNKQVALSSAG
jgi:AraC family transcriptional regulator of adaptative response/methylated-DNA-[protein]-cysteine methyltransferase